MDASTPATSTPPSLRRNTAWALAGNIVYAACQWGVLAFLGHRGNAHQLGLFAVALAVTAPVMLLANLQLRGVQATDSRDEYTFGHYLALRAITIGLALVAIATIVLVTVREREETLVILAMGAAKGIESFSDTIYGLLQRHERLRRIALSMIAKGLLGLVALGIGFAASGSVTVGIAAMAGGWLMMLAVNDLPAAARFVGWRGLIPCWARPQLFRLAILAAPLGAVAALLSLQANIPCYLIEHYLGQEELGRYSAVSYLLIAGNMLINAVGNAASPRLAHAYAAGEFDAFRALRWKMLASFAALGVLALALSFFCGDLVLTIAYGSNFAGQGSLLIWLTVGAAVMWLASACGYSVTAARHFRIQLPLAALSSIGCLIAGLILIPRFGLIGAAWSTIVCAMLLFIGFAAVYWRIARPLTMMGSAS